MSIRSFTQKKELFLITVKSRKLAKNQCCHYEQRFSEKILETSSQKPKRQISKYREQKPSKKGVAKNLKKAFNFYKFNRNISFPAKF